MGKSYERRFEINYSLKILIGSLLLVGAMINKSIKFVKAALVLLALLFASPAFAAEADQTKLPLALGGYDATSYFAGAAPLQGDDNYQVSYKNKRYRFTNEVNQSEFSKNPEKYVPEFGEHCAFSASQGMMKKADPEVFTITNDRLMLFGDEQMLDNWLENENLNYTKAQKFFKYENKYDGGKRLREDTKVRLFSF